MAAKSNKSIFWIIGGSIVLFLILYSATAPTATPPLRNAMAHPGVSGTNKVQYLPVDYSASFPRIATNVRNVFSGSASGAFPGLPSDGNSTWLFTGVGYINGVPYALIETSKGTGDVFLKPGDHWRGMQVASISDDSMALLSSDGQSYHINIGQGTQKKSATPAAVNVPPVQPLTGPIGPLSIQPFGGRRGFMRRGALSQSGSATAAAGSTSTAGGPQETAPAGSSSGSGPTAPAPQRGRRGFRRQSPPNP